MKNLEHQEPGLRSSLYRPLSGGDVRKIVDGALRILEKSGLAVYSPSAFRAFKEAGADTDAETQLVRLPRSLVEDAVASNPSSITLFSRDGNFD